jgi:hypothetical protein
VSDRNRLVQKFKVSFEFELYAGSTGEALVLACGLARSVTQKIEQNRIAEHLEGDSLPTGGTDGAPHGATLDGWHCLWTIARP